MAHRRRRIILNNDGGDIRRPEAGTPEGFLDCRTAPLVGSHVDTVFYCSHYSFSRCRHNTAVGEVAPSTGPVSHAAALIRQGRDCLRIITDFCHDHGMETFWSMRMNDTHDGNARCADFRSRFKKEHPEFLMGVEGDAANHVGDHRWWCAVDYEHPEVRERAFRLIEEVCGNYDVDGVELDFFRHTIYFKRQRDGLFAEPHQLEMMTNFMRRVHAMSIEAGRARGRPLLVSVRVPDAVRICVHIGLDIEQWLAEGLVDILVPGGYWHLAPWTEMIELGHAHEVPVYPCLSGTRIRGGAQRFFEGEASYWRGEAINVWGGGGDGVYTFNVFDPRCTELRELGDPGRLRDLTRTYSPAAGGNIDRFLGEDVRLRFGHLPLPVAPGAVTTARLCVCEELDDDSQAELTLRLRLSDIANRESIRTTLNGVAMSDVRVALDQPPWRYGRYYPNGESGVWLEFSVPPPVLERGDNEVMVACSEPSAVDPLVLQDIQLEVRPR